MEIFGKGVYQYLKYAWAPLLAVALIGQFQVLNEFFLHITFGLSAENFLRLTQLSWAAVVAASVFYLVRKKDLNYKQAAFVGFLYITAFGFLKIATRIMIGNDITYLFMGSAGKVSPLLESVAYISAITALSAIGAMLDRPKRKQ